MKSLISSHRENKRYLFIKGNNLKKNIEESILNFIGVFGMSKVGLSYIKSGDGWIIIYINRESINEVRASFAVWPEKISVERVSGTLKKLKE